VPSSATTTRPGPVARPARRTPRVSRWLGTWSVPAGRRALRAAVLVPAVLAVTFKVIENPQMATYAAFGGFANLVLASFSGTRRDKLVAHVGLGVAGGALLTVGTAVHGSTPVAAVVTLGVTFVVLLAGVAGPNVAAGGLAAMLAYVLAAASPGAASMLPSRLEGWGLATAAAAIAVVAMTPRRAGGELRAVAVACAHALAREAEAAAAGSAGPDLRATSVASEQRLRQLFDAAAYRPTGLATVDQALGSMIELLEWVGELIGDTVADLDEIGDLDCPDRALLAAAGEVLDGVAGMLAGDDSLPDLDRLERLRIESAEALRRLDGDGPQYQAAVHASFHARTIAVAVRSVAADALIALRRASPETVAEQRMQWLPAVASRSEGAARARPATGTDPAYALATAGAVFARHASLRSVWVRNSARGAVAVAAAVTVADLTNVQHGFWVVLGTLSVLRTSATATGSTAARAVLGTTIGFVVGAAIVLVVGTNTTVLWAVLPFAVLIAAYAPGVAPFAAGQAAFTSMLVVLYNLLLPVGWKIGEVRLEDIAVGCGISLVVGLLLWPRGATAVVVDDLHDAFSAAGHYLVDASEWALGQRERPPETGRDALITGLRLEDALRAFLSEQGTKNVAKEDLWALVGAAQRVRLTAVAVAELPAPPGTGPTGLVLQRRAQDLGEWYGRVATHIRDGKPARLESLGPLPAADVDAGPPGHRRACQTYVDQHLRHLYLHHGDVIEPADRLGRAARAAWWRPAPSPA
jgi:uncharacterized membrane protein YccC